MPPAKIKSLNKAYRRQCQVTDVLSFSGLNEIVICYQRAKSQARLGARTIQQEMAWLFCHGLLHLTGYDHNNNRAAQIMRGLEKKILTKD